MIGRKFGGSCGKIRLSTNFKLHLWLHSKGQAVKGAWNKCEKSVKSYFLNEMLEQQPFGGLQIRTKKRGLKIQDPGGNFLIGRKFGGSYGENLALYEFQALFMVAL